MPPPLLPISLLSIARLLLLARLESPLLEARSREEAVVAPEILFCFGEVGIEQLAAIANVEGVDEVIGYCCC